MPTTFTLSLAIEAKDHDNDNNRNSICKYAKRNKQPDAQPQDNDITIRKPKKNTKIKN